MSTHLVRVSSKVSGQTVQIYSLTRVLVLLTCEINTKFKLNFIDICFHMDKIYT